MFNVVFENEEKLKNLRKSVDTLNNNISKQMSAVSKLAELLNDETEQLIHSKILYDILCHEYSDSENEEIKKSDNSEDTHLKMVNKLEQIFMDSDKIQFYQDYEKDLMNKSIKFSICEETLNHLTSTLKQMKLEMRDLLLNYNQFDSEKFEKIVKESSKRYFEDHLKKRFELGDIEIKITGVEAK